MQRIIMWDEGFELRNVSDGEHTLRMFPSRPWHESYKNEGLSKRLNSPSKTEKRMKQNRQPTTTATKWLMRKSDAEGTTLKNQPPEVLISQNRF